MMKNFGSLAILFTLFFSDAIYATPAPPVMNVPTNSTNGVVNVSWNYCAVTCQYRRKLVGTSNYTYGPTCDFCTSGTDRDIPVGRWQYDIKTCDPSREFQGPECSNWSFGGVVDVTREAMPGVPTNFAIDAKDWGDVDLSWTKGSGTVLSYRLSRNGQLLAGNLGRSVTSYADANVAAGSYTYTLEACNTTGCTSTQKVVSVRTDGVSPPGFLSLNPASSTTNLDNTGRVTLNWQRAKGNVQGYAIFASYRPNSSVNYPPLAEIRRVSSETFTLNFVDRVQGEYFYGVKAIRPDGGLGSYSNGNFFYTRYSERPGEPSSFTASVPTPNSQIVNQDFSLRWTAPSGNFERYQLYERQTSPVSGTKKLLYEGTGTEFAVPRPNNGNYQYSIVAVGRLGEVSAARLLNLIIVTTPKVPTNVTVPGYAQSTNIIVNWDFDGVADEFEIYQQSPVGHNYFAAKTIQKQFTVPNQRPGIWSYGVRACITFVTPKLCSDYGRSQSISIQDPQGFKAPQNFTATPANNGGDYIITWQPVEGANHYIVSEAEGLYYSGSKNVHQDSSTSVIMLNKPTGDYFYALRSCFKSETEFRCGHFRFLGTPDGGVHVNNTRDQNDTSVPDAEVVSLGRPDHDPSIGVLGGEVTVSNGTASFSLPIAVAPGRKGMSPSVSVSYSSNDSNGLLGVGFNLSGISSVSRCSRIVAKDEVNAPISLTRTDRLCLDGQPIVLVSGEYGEVGSTYQTEANSFRKIELLGADTEFSSSFFRVTEGNGVITEYGAQGSFSGLNSIHTLPGTNTPLKWPVRLKQDPFGNNIVYQYTTDQSAGEYLIDNIYYTGQYTQRGDRGIHFDYETRAQPSTQYIAGYKKRSTKRLTSIRVFTPTNNNARRYNFNYRVSRLNGQSLIESIQECVGTICRPATTFEWEDNQLDFNFRRLNFNGGFSVRNADTFELGNDIDGDGKPEIVLIRGAKSNFDIYRSFYFSELGSEPDSVRLINLDDEGNEIPLSPELQALVEQYPEQTLQGARRTFLQKPTGNFDFNKDGRADLIARDGPTYEIHYFDGSVAKTLDTGIPTRPFGPSFSQTSILPTPGRESSRTVVQGITRPFQWELFQSGDYNADGRTDFMVTEPGATPGSSQLVAYLDCSTETTMNFCRQTPLYNVVVGTPSNPTELLLTDTNPELQLSFLEPVGEKISAAPDLDGNGIADFFIESGEITRVQSLGGGPEASNPRTISHVLLVKRRANGVLFTIKQRMSDLNLPQPEVTRFGPKPLLMGDINGDGLQDVIHNGTYQLATGNPAKLFNDEVRFAGINLSLLYERDDCLFDVSCNNNRRSSTTSAFYAKDVDADGIDELFYPKNIRVNYCRGTFLLAPGEPEAQCSAADSEVRHVYQWEMIDFHENINGEIEVSYNDFDGQLISSPLTDGFDDLNGDGKPELFAQMGYLERFFVSVPKHLSQEYGDHYQRDINVGAGPEFTGAFFSMNASGDNRVVSITNGTGVTNRFHYQSLNEVNDLHSCGINEDKPFYKTTKAVVGDGYFHFNSSIDVVAKLEQENGVGGFNSTCYRYEDNLFNFEGRGIQGFKRVISEQVGGPTPENNLRMVMEFHQKLPLSGKVKSVRTELTEDSFAAIDQGTLNPISLEEIDYNVAEGQLNSINTVYKLEERKYQYAYNSDDRFNSDRDLLAFSTTHYDYGNNDLQSQEVVYGQLTKKSDVIHEYEQGRIARTYQAATRYIYYPVNLSNWAINLVQKQIDETKAVDYQDNIDVDLAANTNIDRTYTTEYVINPVTRFTEKEISLPGTDLEREIDKLPDAWGNTFRIITRGRGAVDRNGNPVSSTQYASYVPTQGYFAGITNEGLGKRTIIEYDITLGKPVRMTDANGMTMETIYDLFGNVIEKRSNIEPTSYTGITWCTAQENCTMRAETRQDGKPTAVVFMDKFGQETRTETMGFDNKYIGNGQQVIVTTKEYDHLGRVIKAVGGHFEGDAKPQVITTGFDAMNRPLGRITDLAPQYRKVSYNYVGFRTDITVDARNVAGTNHAVQRLSRTYNSQKQLISTIDQMGNPVFYRYDGQNNLIATKVEDRENPGNNLTTTYVYDSSGKRVAINEPNIGRKETKYNAMTQLLWQKDSNGDTISFDYDALGRTTARYINNKLDLRLHYDKQFVGSLDSEEKVQDGVVKEFTYDNIGRVIEQQMSIPGLTNPFVIKQQYDSYYNRIKAVMYPTKDWVGTLYDSYGYPTVEYNPLANDNQLLREIRHVDANNNIVLNFLGNGTEEYRPYHLSGQVDKVCVSMIGDCSQTLMEIDYVYDGWGDTVFAINKTAEYRDGYAYDALHRLIRSLHIPSSEDGVYRTINYAYDGLGNLLQKSDYSNEYQYGGLGYGPNQVRSVRKLDGSQAQFNYDNNGNVLEGDGRRYQYNVINKPEFIQYGANKTTLFYGPEDARYKQVANTDGVETTTYYFDKLLEWQENRKNGSIQKLKLTTYLSDYALLVREMNMSTGKDERYIRYTHNDALGSIDTITDANGEVVERRSHDPFGKPRDHIGNGKKTLDSEESVRGFGRHEHLDGVEIIHMNGRAYDFNLGRFLGADPFVVNPNSTQSFNAYAYVQNNPLGRVDPTGYSDIPNFNSPSLFGGRSPGAGVPANKNTGAAIEQAAKSTEIGRTAVAAAKDVGSIIKAKANLKGKGVIFVSITVGESTYTADVGGFKESGKGVAFKVELEGKNFSNNTDSSGSGESVNRRGNNRGNKIQQIGEALAASTSVKEGGFTKFSFTIDGDANVTLAGDNGNFKEIKRDFAAELVTVTNKTVTRGDGFGGKQNDIQAKATLSIGKLVGILKRAANAGDLGNLPFGLDLGIKIEGAGSARVDFAGTTATDGIISASTIVNDSNFLSDSQRRNSDSIKKAQKERREKLTDGKEKK